MLAAMDDEQLEGATCAGSDLTARLLAELARAVDSLALAEARVHAAASRGVTPLGAMRDQARTCRHHVRSLHRMLSGMPDFAGGSHVAAAGA
jgi:hypothetical protein